MGIPEDVVHIDLSYNSIRHLKAKDFQGAGSLRTLNVSHNNMERMDTGMFGQLRDESDVLTLKERGDKPLLPRQPYLCLED